ncbi:MAG: GNAT family N-acetyltransferase [Desulfovibrionaceae bacterium]|nr:GNAT family N-acetyltransferase [Desulfovibrionaceae bacterium]
MQTMDDYAIRDLFLTEHAGRDCFCVLPGPAPKGAEALDACLARDKLFAYAKTRAADIERANRLEALGFRLAEVGLVFEKRLGPGPKGPVLKQTRFSSPKDREAVVDLAASSFTHSRFYADPRFPDQAAGRIKAAWAGNFFEGKRGQAMVVAQAEGRTAGFLLLLFRAEALVIDLVAVDKDLRGQGLAREMILFAEQNLPGFSILRAGTQARNGPSIGLYQALGFELTEVGCVFHLHRGAWK